MYYINRLIIIFIMAYPAGALYTGSIALDTFLILVGMALILIEVSDIKDKIEKDT